MKTKFYDRQNTKQQDKRTNINVVEKKNTNLSTKPKHDILSIYHSHHKNVYERIFSKNEVRSLTHCLVNKSRNAYRSQQMRNFTLFRQKTEKLQNQTLNFRPCSVIKKSIAQCNIVCVFLSLNNIKWIR